MRSYGKILLLVALMISSRGLAQTPASPAPNLLDRAEWSLYQHTPGIAQVKKQLLADKTTTTYQIQVNKATQPFYKVGLGVSLKTGLASGTRIRLQFRAFSPNANPLTAVLETSTTPFPKVLVTQKTLSPEWKEYEVSGTTNKDYEPNELRVRFQVGYKPGKIVLSDIALIVVPKTKASSEAPKPTATPEKSVSKTINRTLPSPAKTSKAEELAAVLSPEAIQGRIRKYRMGEINLIVRDGSGKPVPDAYVNITQTRHAFLFGCNIFRLEPNNNEEWQRIYQEKFAALFNYATLPFYRAKVEPTQGRRQYDRLEAMNRWCLQHNITTKGHPLIWFRNYPTWAPNDADGTAAACQQYVTETMARFRGQIHYWDVLNEITTAQNDKNGVGAWVRRDGATNVVASGLGWARQASEGARDTLIYNENNTGPGHIQLLTELEKRNALPDAIGLQSHMHNGNWPLERVWGITSNFARFGKPVHFTELTVLSDKRNEISPKRSPGRWNTTEKEAEQADYLVKFYTLLFSHPSVQAITYWDFTDRKTWMDAPAGFLRKDMSNKPVYDRLYNLIKRDWWTQVQGQTDRGGVMVARAFYGDYRITIEDRAGHTQVMNVSLPMGSGSHTFNVVLR